MPGSPAVGNFVAGGIAAVKSAATAAAVGDQKEEGKTLDNLKNGSGAEKVGAGVGLLAGDAGRTIAETLTYLYADGAFRAIFAAGETGSVLGDLTTEEAQAIQGVVDDAGRPLDVVGSAAAGTRRGIGSDLPIGKGPGTRSDIDYVIPPGSHPYFSGLEERLPSLDTRTGIIPGSPNPHIGPSIRFEPNAAPNYVPGK